MKQYLLIALAAAIGGAAGAGIYEYCAGKIHFPVVEVKDVQLQSMEADVAPISEQPAFDTLGGGDLVAAPVESVAPVADSGVQGQPVAAAPANINEVSHE